MVDYSRYFTFIILNESQLRITLPTGKNGRYRIRTCDLTGVIRAL